MTSSYGFAISLGEAPKLSSSELIGSISSEYGESVSFERVAIMRHVTHINGFGIIQKRSIDTKIMSSINFPAQKSFKVYTLSMVLQ